jgi:hypothetical protein
MNAMSDLRFDVCFSFAGEDRPYVERVAQAFRAAGVRIFYDAYEQAALWGENLFEYLDEIYRKRSRFCVVFVSAAYLQKAWTRHELESAQSRALESLETYILPARFDDTEIPGLRHVRAYIDLRKVDPEEFARQIIVKLSLPATTSPTDEPLARSGLSLAVTRAEDLLVALTPTERREGLQALKDMDVPEAGDALSRALTSPFRTIRVEAAFALARRGDQRSVAPLAEIFVTERIRWGEIKTALNSLTPYDRQTFIAQVFNVDPDKLLAYLHETDSIGVPSPALSAAVIDLVTDNNATRRAAAIIAIRKFQLSDGVLPNLLTALEDRRSFSGFHIEAISGPTVAHQAAITIGVLGFRDSLNEKELARYTPRVEEAAQRARRVKLG